MADDRTIEALIDELIGTGTMTEETRADLERIRAENAAGELHPDDRDYIVAFHGRIMGSLSGEPVPEAPDPTDRIADLEERLASALQRAEAAEDEVARLTALIEARAPGEGG